MTKNIIIKPIHIRTHISFMHLIFGVWAKKWAHVVAWYCRGGQSNLTIRLIRKSRIGWIGCLEWRICIRPANLTLMNWMQTHLFNLTFFFYSFFFPSISDVVYISISYCKMTTIPCYQAFVCYWWNTNFRMQQTWASSTKPRPSKT